MRRENLIARMLRALSGKSQEQTGEELGVHPSLIALIETGRTMPGIHHLETLARSAGLTLRDAERVLEYFERLRRYQGKRGTIAHGPLRRLAEAVQAEADSALERLQMLPDLLPRVSDRESVEALWERLSSLSPETRPAVVHVAEELQSWALCERVCEESVRQASRDLKTAASLASLARDIADQVQGPEGWRNRVQGFAASHCSNILRVEGDLPAADAVLEQAKRLWREGADPADLLDPTRLLSLEASLRRDQRRFQEALLLLDQALASTKSPARILVSKGSTLDVMGEHERAVETLQEAEPLIDSEADPQLFSMLRFNLATSLCHLDRHEEASELFYSVRELAAELGDEIFLLRVDWLEGRIAAGTKQLDRAKALLERARQGFSDRKMWYDVALALLETAVLDLEEGRTAEVKSLAKELTRVFESKGVHREALAALRLFRQAVEREEATAELARSVLRYLFRARHDQGLRFTT